MAKLVEFESVNGGKVYIDPEAVTAVTGGKDGKTSQIVVGDDTSANLNFHVNGSSEDVAKVINAERS